MRERTFIRIMLNNIVRNNVFVRVIKAFVNFCYEVDIIPYNGLKYNKKMPLSLEDTKKNLFFQSVGGDRIDCK